MSPEPRSKPLEAPATLILRNTTAIPIEVMIEVFPDRYILSRATR